MLLDRDERSAMALHQQASRSPNLLAGGSKKAAHSSTPGQSLIRAHPDSAESGMPNAELIRVSSSLTVSEAPNSRSCR